MMFVLTSIQNIQMHYVGKTQITSMLKLVVHVVNSRS